MRMSPEQMEWCRPILGEFREFVYEFVGTNHRVLAIYGLLDVRHGGDVALRDLLVVRSCTCDPDERRHQTESLCSRIVAAEWSAEAKGSGCAAWSRNDFRLSVVVGPVTEALAATHLALAYGHADQYLEAYLRGRFGSFLSAVGEDGEPDSHFYPPAADGVPEEATGVSSDALVARLHGKRIVAFTGAGISLSSGVPTFRGRGGLEEHFPLFDRFPGAVAELMVERPVELARTVGLFQASFLTARPNAAHFALAEMERQGVLACVITGNKDRLHERAGSIRVHVKDASHFAKAGSGWEWIADGAALLVVGTWEDEHGLISYARDQGIQIIAVAPERPAFLRAGDWVVEGRAEEVLPRLAAGLR